MNNKNYKDPGNLGSKIIAAWQKAKENFSWNRYLNLTEKIRIKLWQGVVAVLGLLFLGSSIFLIRNNRGINFLTQLINPAGLANGTAILSWNPNTEEDLAGYKIYYGTAPRTADCPPDGGYSSVLDVHNVTSYTIEGLLEGQTYYFSVTAYDTSQNESCFSEEVHKEIPFAEITCSSFTYSAWGECEAGNIQRRTVLSSLPEGCNGGDPILTQSCSYEPTCSSFTYSAWGDCEAGNIQRRTVLSSLPEGCIGGDPVLTQSCSYEPTCSSFTYSAWGDCEAGNIQRRTVLSSLPEGCIGGDPVLTQTCIYEPTCSSFTYSAWGDCEAGNIQRRTVLSSLPEGCIGGDPVLTQSCNAPQMNCAERGRDIVQDGVFDLRDINELAGRLVNIKPGEGVDMNQDGSFSFADIISLGQCKLCMWDWTECQ
jgi:putative component of membrane protein insertase Oxa1/YidC/SpoIIIJ protein YidD